MSFSVALIHLCIHIVITVLSSSSDEFDAEAVPSLSTVSLKKMKPTESEDSTSWISFLSGHLVNEADFRNYKVDQIWLHADASENKMSNPASL